MLRLTVIASCLAIPSVAFAADHPQARMKKPTSSKICLYPPKQRKVGAFPNILLLVRSGPH
jgi:hypothetical protein